MSSAAATDPRRRPVPIGVGRGRPVTGEAVEAPTPTLAQVPPSPVLVVGLGNPILGDDGVGWKVIDALESRIAREAARIGPVELERMSVGGLTLMERLVGCERAIVVDAVLGPDRPGTIQCLPLERMATRLASHLDSAHDAGLLQALRAGQALGARLPHDILVVGIAVERIDVFDERLSPAVAAAVDTAADTVIGLLHRPSEGAH